MEQTTLTSQAPSLSGKTPNDKMQYTITRKELPLHCPMPGTTLWNSHPRVFIKLGANGKGKCPYCGAEYTLQDNG